METSKGELVPGGLALVICGGEDQGKVVEVSLFCLEDVDYPHPFVRERVVRILPGEGDGWLVIGNLVSDTASVDVSDYGWAFFDATDLMPINPEADPLDVEEEQCQTA